MTSTNPDPDTLGRAQIAAMDALIDSGLGRKVRGDGNDMAAVVDVVVAAAEPLIAADGRAEGQRQALAAIDRAIQGELDLHQRSFDELPEANQKFVQGMRRAKQWITASSADGVAGPAGDPS